MLFFSILFIGVLLLPLGSLFLVKHLAKSGFKPAVEVDSVLKSDKEILKNSVYLLTAIGTLCISWVIFNNSLSRFDIANFWLHFFGGGVVSSLIFLFFKNSTKFKVDVFRQLIFLYFFTSGLGVMSELLEYLLQTITRIKFTNAAEDTWRDLLANTLGAFLGFLLITSVQRFYARFKKNSHK